GHCDRRHRGGFSADVFDSSRRARTSGAQLVASRADAGRFGVPRVSRSSAAARVAGRARRDNSFFRAGARRIWRHADARRQYSGQNRNDSDRDLFRRGSKRDEASCHLVPDRYRNFGCSSRRALLLDAPPIAGAVAVGAALMALEVQIEKKLPNFALEVSFRAEAEPLSILGASGAGKTMLLRCIAGLERPDRGRVALNDRVFFDSAQHLWVPARQRRVGMRFQHYALFPHRSVADNIAFGLHNLPHDEQTSRVAELVRQTHLAGLEDRYPQELSGGEQQ